jgi:hypothetical protein
MNIKNLFRRIDVRGVSLSSPDITGILPIIGYVLVTMSFIDYISVITEFQLNNFENELNSISLFAEHSWVFLIGLGFIFTRYFTDNQSDIRHLEVVFQKIFRWVILIMGIAFLLLIPLVFLDTGRLLKSFNDQINEQQNTNIEQINQLEKNLASVVNEQQLKVLGRNIKMSPEELNLAYPQLKNAIEQKLITFKNSVRQETEKTKREKYLSTWKTSRRVIISLVILSFTFVIIWFKIGAAF